MHEIEIKAKLREPEKVMRALAGMGCELSEPVVQDDAVYLRRGLDYAQARNAEIFLRIRKQNDETIFTLKKAKTNELDCVEKETLVQDAEALAQMLDLMGFDQVMRIVKTRRKGRIQNFEICVDEVRDLGWFIEVEAFSDEPAEDVQHAMWEILKPLGITEDERTLLGYDSLLHNQTKTREAAN